MIKETYRYGAGCVERRVEKTGSRTTVSVLDLPHGFPPLLPPDQAWWQVLLKGGRVRYQIQDQVRLVDLFCGTGGLTLGASLALEAAGYMPVPLAAADIDGGALSVYRHNFKPAVTLHGSVAAMVDYHVYGRGKTAELAYPPEVLAPEMARNVGTTDLLLAGPPCEGHSNLNNHTRRSDPRNQLYVCTAAVAIALQARMVVIENVPEVVADRSEVVPTARKILIDAGYHVSQAVLNASKLGGGQMRRRHFTIATTSPHMPIDESAKVLARSPMRLREVIGDLEDRTSGDFMDEVTTLSAENQARVNYLFDHDLYDLPDDERPDCHKSGHTYPSVYGRLYWDRPSPTITTGFMTPGRGRFIHPTRRRVITAREASRIQGFPDSFSFSADGATPGKKQLSKWIGDAVPTQLGYVAVLTALSSL